MLPSTAGPTAPRRNAGAVFFCPARQRRLERPSPSRPASGRHRKNAGPRQEDSGILSRKNIRTINNRTRVRLLIVQAKVQEDFANPS